MLKQYLILILLVFSGTICFSQTALIKSNCTNYYFEKIKLQKYGKNYKDTVVLFRNYIKGADDKRIMCRKQFRDYKLEKLMWNCKYLSSTLHYRQKDELSILNFKQYKDKVTIVTYYLCYRKSRKTLEMMRFEVVNYKITGINVLPHIVNGFIPIEEFNRHENVIP